MAFRLAIEKYPRQNEVVRQAREAFRASGRASADSAPVPGGLVLRKLDIPAGVPSPDGKYIAPVKIMAIYFFMRIETKKKMILRFLLQERQPCYGASWSPTATSSPAFGIRPRVERVQIWELGKNEPLTIRMDDSIEPGNIAGWALDTKSIYLQYRLHVSAEKS